MGLIRAALTATKSTLADSWKEYFYCEAIPNDCLVVRGYKSTGKKSSNVKGNDNVITNGSGIAVADGQCMIIVENGKIVDFCAEPGEYTYDYSTEPSLFDGDLGEGIKNTFKQIGKRFTFGGDAGKDQRVYYFNIKELVDNKFGTANPVPFRVVDSKIGLDVDVALRCSGVYSYKISDPILFYTNVSGNISEEYRREEIDKQLKTEFISALAPALGKLSDMELRPNQVIAHTTELEDAINEALSKKWGELRGLKVVSIALGSVTLSDEDAELIKTAQKTAMLTNPNMAAATMVEAQASAMKSAAANTAGAMTGFMGMGMAMNAGGVGNVNSLYAMGQQNTAANSQANTKMQPQSNNTWKCECGTNNTGKFCSNCGKAAPVLSNEWTCECGAKNTGKFCSNCGKAAPVLSDEWTCECGTNNTGKFCSNCGNKRP